MTVAITMILPLAMTRSACQHEAQACHTATVRLLESANLVQWRPCIGCSPEPKPFMYVGSELFIVNNGNKATTTEQLATVMPAGRGRFDTVPGAEWIEFGSANSH